MNDRPLATDRSHYVDRRDFLQRAGQSVAAAGAAITAAPLALADNGDSKTYKAESLVQLLHESLSPRQKEVVCFDWNHREEERGLLRTRVAANWQITDPSVYSDFFDHDQQYMIRAIVENVLHPEFHTRFDKQQLDDAGGFGKNNSIAIFGQPGEGHYEMVVTGRHLTLRCDGNTTDHVAFGGPIFYGHDPSGSREEEATHPGNVFWPQAVEANKLYQALDGKQQQLALVQQSPDEESVAFRGDDGPFDGIPVSELSDDQRQRVQEVLQKLIEPFRQSDRDEVVACLKAKGGLDACHLAFYQDDDIGDDGVWDNWRLEGPAFVWHFRGAPHVHVWVNVANNSSVKLNA